jgi:PhzF family phenazine biosynthesis protein
MLQIPIFQVDAFASAVFSGNPAAVCPLKEWLPDPVLQSIAAENNLSETAFFVPNGAGYHLRWFTPSCEVDLCGHATLASAYVLLRELQAQGDTLHFQTRSGELAVQNRGDLFFLNFPSRPPQPRAPDAAVDKAIGGQPVEICQARDYLLTYASAAEVRALTPDMSALTKLDYYAFIATAPGEDCDFVSRFFAPARGIPEDPVTGSAHCTLIPYWSRKLQKTELLAKQVSSRGGELVCKLTGERVEIGGRAAIFFKGEISI